MTKKELLKIMRKVLPDAEYTERYFRERENRITKQWVDSNYTDFSVYDHEDYLYELFLCYEFVTRGSIEELFKYFNSNGVDYSNLSFFDDYPGIGLSTFDLLEKTSNVSYFNDNIIQVMHLKSILGFDLENDLDKTGTYDVILSFEIAEHYESPVDEYIKPLLKRVNKGGYLALSTGFKNMYVGHFPIYIIEGEKVDHLDALEKIIEFILSSGFTHLHSCPNSNPTIYRKEY